MAKRDLPWKKFLFTFGDERCVPPENDESNFRMANEALFRQHPCRIHPFCELRGEIEPVLAAKNMKRSWMCWPPKRRENLRARFDFAWLGDDGTLLRFFRELGRSRKRSGASWQLRSQIKFMAADLHFPINFAARAVCFLIGANKDPKLIERIFSGDLALPAAWVDQNAKSVTWIIEQKS